jgi:6-phosphogluconolactonase
MTGRVEIFGDAKRQAEFVADWLIVQMVEATSNFRLVLSGGSTPRMLYSLLARPPWRDRVPWRRLQLFWGDERFVPHNDPESNFGMTFTTLLREVPIPADRIHPIPVNGTPRDCAARYEALLKQFQATDQSGPLFDVVLLGLGADGHTASLLPESPVLAEQEHWVAAVDHGRPQPRITLTYPAIARSRAVAFLVAGVEKQSAVLAALAHNEALPAARVRSQGEVIWFLDRDAAGSLYHR